MGFNVTDFNVPDEIVGEGNGKRHVYAIVEGESPISTPPSTPHGKEQNTFRRKFPNIFPREKSLVNGDSISEVAENYVHDIASDSSFENKQNFRFNKVTLI